VDRVPVIVHVSPPRVVAVLVGLREIVAVDELIVVVLVGVPVVLMGPTRIGLAVHVRYMEVIVRVDLRGMPVLRFLALALSPLRNDVRRRRHLEAPSWKENTPERPDYRRPAARAPVSFGGADP
jgi:hypothetical protein